MDIYMAKLLVAKFEMDQLAARVLGPLSLEDLFIQFPKIIIPPHELIGPPCCVNKTITCSRDLNDFCQGCPEYKEKDGE